MEGLNIVAPHSQALELKVPPHSLFSESSQKSSQSHLLCPQFPPEPCIYLACVWGDFFFFLISGVRRSFKTPNFRDFSGMDLCCSSRGGSHHVFAICQPVPGMQSLNCAAVGSLWQKREESQHQDLLSAGFPAPMLRNSAAWLAPSVIIATQGILRPCFHTWGSAPLCYLSTFNPGQSSLYQTSKSSDFVFHCL